MPVKISKIPHVKIYLVKLASDADLTYDSERSGNSPVHFGHRNGVIAYSIAEFHRLRDLIDEFDDALIEHMPKDEH